MVCNLLSPVMRCVDDGAVWTEPLPFERRSEAEYRLAHSLQTVGDKKLSASEDSIPATGTGPRLAAIAFSISKGTPALACRSERHHALVLTSSARIGSRVLIGSQHTQNHIADSAIPFRTTIQRERADRAWSNGLQSPTT